MNWAPPSIQQDVPKRTFTWGPDAIQSDSEVLISFSPEFAIQNATTDVELFYFDRDTLTWEKIVFPPEDPEQQQSSSEPELEWQGDDATVEDELAQTSTPTGGQGLRIRAGGIAVEVIPTQNFDSAEEAYAWAEGWWRARQRHLITGRGRIYGDGSIAPGQVHELLGLGGGLSGDWYFTEVKHRYSASDGYYIDFTARRILE